MSLIDLYISDGGRIRRIGDNCHDMLTIEGGELCYYNLQNGDGCRLGEDGEWYKFVDNVDEYGYNCDPRKTEQTEVDTARAIVHKMIDNSEIAEDAYPDLRQRLHDAVDEYEPQTEREGE